MRRSLAWLVTVPLMLAGSQVAHVFAYRWVYPSSHVRLTALLNTGHGYMNRLPLVLGIAGAIAAISLVVAVADAARGRAVRALPPAAFAVLPLGTFVIQEVLERSLHTGTFFWQAVQSPTFVPGLLLQLPFAAAAYVIARLLLRTASAIGRAISVRRKIVVRAPKMLAVVRTANTALPRVAPLASAAAGRAPPPVFAH